MFKPRNTLVVLKLIQKAETQVGKLVVPNGDGCYTEAEVVAVGPGTIEIEGQRPATFDLKPGQRVYVKHKEKRNPQMPAGDAALMYRDGDETFHIVEQSSIVGILAEPGEFPAVELTDENAGIRSPAAARANQILHA